ncbi:sigma factor-like helix-turn-helix DNA-binding protein [Roseomonas sp. E05]|uniref:sigma factor-like helix-turn-helix DNA-binding protein n=1 Tax=Roseomonas sp. E05 TaxID=3046310 RepID=UPI0024B92BF7|nr:sigma factor-like helix-turn-helix DNA-binding protein [Roseomonas sp. E05]MDJ0391152.1 sigma factor-like helix-turn-helix DNA-binding protein [Roseomonas sp. E05]
MEAVAQEQPRWPEMVGLDVLGGLDADATPDAIAGEPGGEELPLRLVEDVWAEPTARKLLRPLLVGRLAPAGTPDLGIHRAGLMAAVPSLAPDTRSILWTVEVPQPEFDDWRRTTPHAEPALRAIGRWLLDGGKSLGAAYAAEFTAEALMDVFLARFEGRQKQLLLARADGRTLQELADKQGVTRERIRQISTKTLRILAADLARAQGVFMPAVQALAHHAEALAGRVLTAASEAESILRSGTERRWICRALPPSEARVLLILDDAAAEMPPEEAAAFDPLSRIGRPLAGGRTSLPWSDDDIARLRDAFASACGERRFSSLSDVAHEAALPEAAVRDLAALAGLSIHGPAVLDSNWKAADLRGAFAASVLAKAGRPLHQAEIFMAGLGDTAFPEWSYRGLIQALQAAPEAFRSDGSSLWALREGLEGGADVVDLRPDCPRMRAGPDARTPPFSPRQRLLAGLDPAGPAFVAEAAARIGAALRHLPGDGPRSLAEVVGDPADLDTLLAWLHAPWPQGGSIDSAPVGLCLLAASVAATRRTATEGWGTWETLRNACGMDARRALFNTQDAPEHRTLSAILRAVATHRLRHALDHQGDPWVTLLRLQWGFRRADLASLPHWLRDNEEPPPAIRHLAAAPETGVAELWSALKAAASGRPNAEALMAAETLPWWPDWSVREVLDRLADPAPVRPRGGRCPDDATPGDDRAATGEGTLKQALPQLATRLSEAGDRFEVHLPPRLSLPPGPVVASGEGFRVGGVVGATGEVAWHHGTGWLALPLRGPGARDLRIEAAAADDPLLLHVRLWDPEAFLAVFDLARAGRTALDPYAANLSPAGPHALLLHEGLAASAAADEEAALDGGYRLLVYRKGLPDRFEVACDGQAVWQSQRQEARPVLDMPPATLSGDGGKLGWGQTCAIEASGLPDGFVPSRAHVGGQTLRPSGGGPPWKFEGYVLLPGADPAHLKARIEGRLDGVRAAVPAVVHVRRPERGAALRRDGTVRHLLSSSVVDRTRDAGSRLWVSRPADEASADYVVLEGVRPAARHGYHGALLSGVLVALGEPLTVAPGSFNRNGRSFPVAAAVLDRVVIASASPEGGTLRLTFSAPLSWSEGHRVHGWGRWGSAELAVGRASPDGMHLDVEPPRDDLAGIVVSHGSAWLGSAYLRPDPIAETAEFLADGDLEERLGFALSARLPLLGGAALKAAGQRLLGADRATLAVLLRGIPDTQREYVAGRLLARWVHRSDEAAALVRDFESALEHSRPAAPLLERLVRAAPCAAARILRDGMEGMARARQKRLLTALMIRTWPPGLPDGCGMPSPGDPDRCAAEADATLLEVACRATRTDRQFLASRAEASIASLAWAASQQVQPQEQPENLATALALPPVRRWIAAHLLARLILTGR